MSKGYARTRKTPFGKPIKPRKPKPAFESPMKMRFVTWSSTRGESFPKDPAEQLSLMLKGLRGIKNKEVLDSSIKLLDKGIWFSQVPRERRTLVFRLEQWNTGEIKLAKVAKSEVLADGTLVYAPVKVPYTWVLREADPVPQSSLKEVKLVKGKKNGTRQTT